MQALRRELVPEAKLPKRRRAQLRDARRLLRLPQDPTDVDDVHEALALIGRFFLHEGLTAHRIAACIVVAIGALCIGHNGGAGNVLGVPPSPPVLGHIHIQKGRCKKKGNARFDA